MPLYVCTGCGHIENTACANYWYRDAKGLPALCSLCDPDIGKWHGLFERRLPTEADREHIIGSPEEAARRVRERDERKRQDAGNL